MSGCIRSTSALTANGYSRFKTDGGWILAHRYVLEKKLGRPIKDGYESCHSCDVPNCINDEHLFEGTHKENMIDMISKGRGHNGNILRDACKKCNTEFTSDNLKFVTDAKGKRVRRCKNCYRLAMKAANSRRRKK